MADENVRAEPTRANRGGRRMQLLIVALLMIGEGVGICVLAGSLSRSPLSALAALGESDAGADGAVKQAEQVEVEVAECRPSNKMSGRFITFHLRVSVLVATGDAERVEKMARTKRARLHDRVNFVVRSADPKHLNEPGLDTLKRRLKQEFDRIFGDDRLILGVLIPEMLQSGSGV